ncbi:MAG: HPP family protein [Candidatus Altiarchaeota archaeon]|nr:HPP family protein [Candidatus Altiarchaeota archaeon]
MGDEPDYMAGKVRHIIFPAILAGLTIFIIATVWDIKLYGIIFACFGSSAFIVYVNPRSEQASVHNILGAYPLAGFFGYAVIEYFLPHLTFEENINLALAGGFAVGITMLAMLITGFKHAPAGGAALAFVLKVPDVKAVFLLIGGGITLLVLAKILTFIVKEEYELEEAVKHALIHPKKRG